MKKYISPIINVYNIKNEKPIATSDSYEVRQEQGNGVQFVNKRGEDFEGEW